MDKLESKHSLVALTKTLLEEKREELLEILPTEDDDKIEVVLQEVIEMEKKLKHLLRNNR